MEAVSFQYSKPSFTLGVKKKDGGPGLSQAALAASVEDPTLRLFRELAQQADLPALPPVPSCTPTSTKPQDAVGLSSTAKGKEQPAAHKKESPLSIHDDASHSAEASVATERPPAEEEYIPVEITVPTPAAPSSAAATTAGTPSTSSAADIETTIGRRPYWMQHCKRIRSPLLRLHQEMVELTELLQPTPEEMQARRQAVAEVADIVKSLWPTAQVNVFGSFATGLYVPTSDIDLVITDSRANNIQSALKALATALTRTGVAHKMQVISKARVPIIKFETVEHGGLAFDVSFDVANGPQAAELVREFMGAWPMMRPLVLVLKLFLQQRELNEVYTGGIGSYALITMISAFLQLHNSRLPCQPDSSKRGKGSRQQPQQTALLEPCLGVLVVDFFRLFGRVLNLRDVGMASSDGGHYFKKGIRPDGSDWINSERPYLLSVEDPKDATNDICRSSYNIMRVKSAFEFAYQQLTAPSLPDESLLARILRLGAILVSRKRPTNLRALYAAKFGGKVQDTEVPQPKQPEQKRGQKRERGGSDEAGPSRKEMRSAGDQQGRGSRGRHEGKGSSSGSLGSSQQGGSSEGEEEEEGEEGTGREEGQWSAGQQAANKKAARKRQKSARKARQRAAMLQRQ